jgi:hypothetical protein
MHRDPGGIPVSRPLAFPAALAVLAAAALSIVTVPLFPDTCLAQATPVTTGVGTKETSLQRIQRMVAKINAEASTPEGEDAVVARLSQQLKVPGDSLRQQHARWGLGYGEVSMVYGFSKSSKKKGVTPEQVVEMRRSGMEWEAIGKELGVKVDTVASKMKKTVGPNPKPQPKPAK